jgi:hypothetical protein
VDDDSDRDILNSLIQIARDASDGLNRLVNRS